MWIRRLAAGFSALVWRRGTEQDLDEELRAYLEAATADNIRAGMAPADAGRAARAALGSLEAVKDRTRDVGWETSVENLWRDLRYAVRTLRRSPAFTIVVVCILALGIGANTAIFSVVNAVLLRSLNVARPSELVSLQAVYPGDSDATFSYAAYRRFAEEGLPVVQALAASNARRDAVTVDGLPEPFDVKLVSGNYFATLGVGAALGRTLQPSDDVPGRGEPVAVLSDAYWTRRFGRDPSVVGRTVRFRASVFTIVGVAAREFSGETVGESVDAWIPLTAQPGAPPWVWSGHSTTWLRILARRQPGVTLEAARAGLEPVYARLREEIADGATGEYRQRVLESRLAVLDASGGSSRLRDNLRTPLVILMGIVGLVLTVACANVATLLLARAESRRRQIAVCLAIGAGRFRVARQGIAEALLLAAIGGAGGLLLAAWSGSMLAALVAGVLPVSLDLALDARVLLFAVVVSSGTALVCGVLPAMRAARVDPLPAMRTAPGGRRLAGRIPVTRALVVTQIAVSLVLLVAAGLFTRSVLRIGAIETGFDPDQVLVFRVTPPAADEPLSPDAARELYRQLLARAERVPGVEAASASSVGLFTNATWGNAITVDGYVPQTGVTPRTFANLITPRYFDVMRIAVERGRGFTDADGETAMRVAVVNQTFARQFLTGADPVGRRVGLCTSDPCAVDQADMRTIVGVVADLKYVQLREERRPMLYVPFAQHRDPHLHQIEVRTAGAPASVARTLHRELSGVDSRVGIVAVTELRDQVNASIGSERLLATFSTALGILALALAAVGLYGVVACATTGRTGELGIRIALGACRSDVRRLVLRDTLRLVVIGAAIGLPAAMAAARLLAGQLYEVEPHDPLVAVAGLLILLLAAVLAGYLPARRASRVDPVVALRAE